MNIETSELLSIPDWIHKAELRPISTVTAEPVAADEEAARVNSEITGGTRE
ncbi:hypothetical protein HSR121_0706 [Halapricum desulfuricans]|uniref:Uncharacterized protein n=1 Tax=Halapricum desulfuricans TaxID=2841257 RepID=A0A897MSE5_9EURY|nr:hypothetical protein HSR121_0706 [Halapricum desulfuricans]